jgi:hypothetical protein
VRRTRARPVHSRRQDGRDRGRGHLRRRGVTNMGTTNLRAVRAGNSSQTAGSPAPRPTTCDRAGRAGIGRPGVWLPLGRVSQGRDDCAGRVADLPSSASSFLRCRLSTIRRTRIIVHIDSCRRLRSQRVLRSSWRRVGGLHTLAGDSGISHSIRLDKPRGGMTCGRPSDGRPQCSSHC